MNANATSLNDPSAYANGTVAVTDRVRGVLAAHGRLNRDALALADNDDLYEAGMTSLASVNVMLALEGEFDIEFPDQMLNRSVFATVAAVAAAIAKIRSA